MGVLSDLVARLQTRLRTVQAECSPDDLQRAIESAAQAYSERRPRVAPLTLTWAPGVADATLPQDWMDMEPESWAAATNPVVEEQAVYDGRGYGRLGRGALLPAMPAAGSGYTYRIYPGYPGKVRVSPVPVTTLTVSCDYHGAHVVSDSDGQTTVPRPDWDLILLRAVYELWADIARERAARPVSFEAAGDGNSQRIRMADPDQLQKLAEAGNAEFLRRLNRPWGVRA